MAKHTISPQYTQAFTQHVVYGRRRRKKKKKQEKNSTRQDIMTITNTNKL